MVHEGLVSLIYLTWELMNGVFHVQASWSCLPTFVPPGIPYFHILEFLIYSTPLFLCSVMIVAAYSNYMLFVFCMHVISGSTLFPVVVWKWNVVITLLTFRYSFFRYSLFVQVTPPTIILSRSKSTTQALYCRTAYIVCKWKGVITLLCNNIGLVSLIFLGWELLWVVYITALCVQAISILSALFCANPIFYFLIFLLVYLC